MRFHFKLDDPSSDHANTLLPIGSAMTTRSATNVYNLNALDVAHLIEHLRVPIGSQSRGRILYEHYCKLTVASSLKQLPLEVE